MDEGNTALLNAINTALNELMDDGTVHEIIAKYISCGISEMIPMSPRERPCAALFVYGNRLERESMQMNLAAIV